MTMGVPDPEGSINLLEGVYKYSSEVGSVHQRHDRPVEERAPKRRAANAAPVRRQSPRGGRRMENTASLRQRH